MNSFDLEFPVMPTYKGYWYPIYFEPVVGSGERITVAVAAIGTLGEYQVIQAIRTELLECLYGIHAPRIHSMIDLIISSSQTCLKQNKDLSKWKAPFDGVILGAMVDALDTGLKGILKQGIRLSSSLSSLALDAERDDEEELQPKRYASQFSKNIQQELKLINPTMLSSFNQKVQISDSEIMTTYGFMNDNYASNFGLLIPTRMSISLNSIKAKLFDIEALKKSAYLMKPERFDMIIGTPSLDDPTLSDKAIDKLKNTLEMIEEIAFKEDINIFRADNAHSAAAHINQFAA